MAYGIAMETWWLAFLNLVCATPLFSLFSGFPSAQAMPGPLHFLREDSLCHPRHVELWKMRVQRTSCATGQRAGSVEDHSGANFTVNHHDRVHGRMTIVHSSRALQVIHRNVHHSFPYSPRIPAIILDLFISLLFFWQLKCMQTLGFCWKSGVPSTRSSSQPRGGWGVGRRPSALGHIIQAGRQRGRDEAPKDWEKETKMGISLFKIWESEHQGKRINVL